MRSCLAIPPHLGPACRAVLLGAALLARSHDALGYRPFDSTDAAVAPPREFELELGPAGVLLDGSDRTLIAPAYVLNLGLAEGWELVLQGRGQEALSSAAHRASFAGNALLLKGMLRDGVLQERAGPSVATESGLLLPGIHQESGVGASWAAIVSQRWSGLTVHLNAAAALTHEHRADLFVGTIFEGPSDWRVRPVAELFVEREFGTATTVSGLVGAIWRVRENLSFDLGLREASVNGRAVSEVRVGLTFGWAAW
ncbi:hypothetical protein [Siccirubricoccus sp. G192]|uniref:hypothetical protein n=1 Tax=Siccirubricoccus sp. G192 TaxID=2849651 RepID=UPI001C2C9CDE|nr:hypothetical protein [Siccirubricoccus sp. G192]MBV1799202.1 hypothetical protein [Siccirubricoccus sp. G192]